MTIYRVTLEEVDKIGGRVVENHHHVILEGGYESEDKDILASIEMQLDEWEEDIAKEILYEGITERLAIVVGALLQDSPFPEINPMDVNFNPANETAEFDIEVGDQAATIIVKL